MGFKWIAKNSISSRKHLPNFRIFPIGHLPVFLSNRTCHVSILSIHSSSGCLLIFIPNNNYVNTQMSSTICSMANGIGVQSIPELTMEITVIDWQMSSCRTMETGEGVGKQAWNCQINICHRLYHFEMSNFSVFVHWDNILLHPFILGVSFSSWQQL